MACNDGITYAITNKKTEDDLLAELSKAAGEDTDYLEKIELTEVKKMYSKITLKKKETDCLVSTTNSI
jgi:hypothetical protein